MNIKKQYLRLNLAELHKPSLRTRPSICSLKPLRLSNPGDELIITPYLFPDHHHFFSRDVQERKQESPVKISCAIQRPDNEETAQLILSEKADNFADVLFFCSWVFTEWITFPFC